MSSPTIDQILATPAGKVALAKAQEKMANDPNLFGQQISPRSLQALDYVKRSFDDQISAARRSGEKDDARILTAQKNQLVAGMDAADATIPRDQQGNPLGPGLYQQARAAYSGPATSADALENGGSIFNKQPEQISDEINQLSPGDRQFYLVGARDALAQRTAKTSAGGNEALRIVGNQQVKDQLAPLFPDDASFKAFIGQAQLESAMYRNFNNTLGNSRTFRRAANAAALEDEHSPGVLANALAAGAGFGAHEPFAAVPSLLRAIKGAGNWFNRPSPAVDAAMGRMLWTSDPQQNAATLNAMLNARRGLPPFSLAGGTAAPLGLIAGETYR